MSIREKLEGLVERSIQSGKPQSHRSEWEAELAGASFPRGLLYLWAAYNRLRRRQGSSGYGPLPLGWPEIDAFLRRSKLNLAPWEIEVIEELDDLYMMVHASSYRKRDAD